MPDNVRLIQLQPGSIGGDDRPGSRNRSAARAAALASDRVPLIIAGESKSDEELLRFVDNLFGRPDLFDNPNLLEEARNEEGDRIRFTLHVTYLPRTATPGMSIEEEPVVEETAAPPAPPAPHAADSETE
jgi:hypothetical protein